MSSQKLKKQCLSDPEHTILALCKTPNHEVIGHAFATYWNYGPGALRSSLYSLHLLHNTPHRLGEVCWITQLVVSAAHRRKGIASMLLRFIRDQRTFHAMGLVSSHPAACIALSELGGTVPICVNVSVTSDSRNSGSRWIKAIDMAFIGDNATAILATSPIEYLRTARLVGSAFNPTSTTTAISSVYTNFFVDHVEPLEALTEFLAKAGQEAWPLGELLDGHEFLIIVRR